MRWIKGHFILSCILIYALIIVILGVVVWGNCRPFDMKLPIDFDGFTSIGSFIGGVFGTFFAALAVYYAYLTFRKDVIKSRFYEMLKQHNNNVKSISISGVDVFGKYIDLLSVIYASVQRELSSPDDDNSPNNSYFKLAYFYFFYGSMLDADEIISKIDIEEKQIKKMNDYFSTNNIKLYGHSKELGIYFRQLYQIITYINDNKILEYREKYGYIKSLRVCLNLNEQYLLFLNSLSVLGDVWELSGEIEDENKKLITKYNLVKNLPKSYNDNFLKFKFESLYPHIDYEYYKGDDTRKKKREEWEKQYS
ncbi:MAG: putative phage abortive infection protein [Bacteroides sp.]|jgi:hypothetical protein|nr:putative phage abortive infection protein [Bacteroides sp.]